MGILYNIHNVGRSVITCIGVISAGLFILFVLSYDGFSKVTNTQYQSKKKIGISKFLDTGVNTEEIVDKLVEVESEKGEKYQKEVSNQIIRKAIINFLEHNLRELRDLAKSMYDYRSPFQSRVGVSQDESVVRILPNRGAEVGEIRVKVDKVAKPDVFISDPVPVGYELKPFKVTISLGDRSFEIDFKGGKLQDLAKKINEVAKEIVSASVIRLDDATEVLRIEGKKTGKRAKVAITGEVEELVKIGLLTKERTVHIERRELDVLKLFTPYGSFTVKEREEFSREVSYRVGKNTVLEVSNAMVFQQPPRPREVDIRVMEGVKVSNVEVRGGTPITTFDIFMEYVSNDLSFIVILFGDGTKREIAIAKDQRDLKVNLSFADGKDIERITLRNGNDLVRITFYRILLHDRLEERERIAEYEPKNYISRAENAVIHIGGVRIERESNDITDVINGTIKLIGESQREVSLRVEYDFTAITNSISNLVGKYNDVMIYLAKITKPVVDRRQLCEKPDEEKEEGAFATDMDLTRLKDKLRMYAMQPYQTRSTNIRLLYHIGVYTKDVSTKLDFESDLWEYVRRGVLSINSDRLLAAISENFFAVSDIFGYDTNGDKVADSGFSHSVSTLCDEYVRPGGVFANKKKQIDNSIKANKEMYAKFQEHLEEYRASLERKFGKLQQVLRDSKSKQEWFKNQMKVIGNRD